MVALAEKLKAFPTTKPQLPIIDRGFVLDTIIYNNFSRANLELVKKRTDLETNNKYTIEDIAEGIRKAMGTSLFNQINYTTFSKDNKTHLQLNASEYYKSQMKASLHFDTFRGFGAIINYTGRNLLGESSRILVTGDIAQQPRIRLQYQKYLVKKKIGGDAQKLMVSGLLKMFLYNVKKQTISNSMPFILKTKLIETSIL